MALPPIIAQVLRRSQYSLVRDMVPSDGEVMGVPSPELMSQLHDLSANLRGVICAGSEGTGTSGAPAASLILTQSTAVETPCPTGGDDAPGLRGDESDPLQAATDADDENSRHAESPEDGAESDKAAKRGTEPSSSE